MKRLAGRGAAVSAALDAALALALAGLAVSLLAQVAAGAHLGWRGALAFLLVLAHTLPIAFRRRHPFGVLGLSVGSALGVVAIGLPFVVLGPAMLVPVYTVAARLPRQSSLRALAVVVAAALASEVVRPGTVGDGSTVAMVVAVLVAAWLLGDNARRREVAVAVAEERARQLEDAREELARQAVIADRLRIARELHDVVAHGMSVIAVQSAAGRLVIDSEPAVRP